MERYSKQQLENLTSELAQAAGVPAGDAMIFARALVDADLHGTSTHGLSRLAIYLERLQKGLIDAKAQLGVERRKGGTLTLDAGNGLGQVQATKALEMMMPIARENGVSIATIRNSQHFGALSYYCNMAAERNFILLAMTNGEPAMSPEGGSQAFFGTNPMAASIPTGKGFAIKIDLATAGVARGNIITAKKKGAAIPLGWALDADGEPTTDAEKALVGTVLTMAGHKGYALALMIEVLCGVLSGAAIGDGVGSMYKNLDRKQDVGHFFCLMDIDAFMDRAEFIARIDAMVDDLKACRKRPGVSEILVPGERSSRIAARNGELGIPIAPETIAEIKQWCERLAVTFPMNRTES